MKSLRVVRVTKIEVESTPVYDIEVKKNSNFTLASGAVVHNSKDLADAVAGSLYAAFKYESKHGANISTDDYLSAISSELNKSRGGIYNALRNSSTTRIHVNG